MKKPISFILSLVMLFAAAVFAPPGYSVAASEHTFTDVPASRWAYGDIEYAAANGLVNGTGDGKYSPDLDLNYAQFLTMVVRLRWANEAASVSGTGKAWWYPAMVVAQNHGLTARLDSNFNKPQYNWADTDVNGDISRYDMAAVLTSYLENINCLPTDKNSVSGRVGDFFSIPLNYVFPVSTVVKAGLINGVNENGDFAGTLSVNRAQAAAILARTNRLYGGTQSTTGYPVDETPSQETPVAQPSTPTTPTTPATPVSPVTGRDSNGNTLASGVNAACSVYKSDNYPTRGTADKQNKNGYYTEADVDISGTILKYDSLDMVNAERAKAGLKPFKWTYSDEMEEYTLLRAKEISTNWAHWRQYGDLREPSVADENIARGRDWASPQVSSQSAIDAFMNSPGHRQLVLTGTQAGSDPNLQYYYCAAACGNTLIMTVFTQQNIEAMTDHNLLGTDDGESFASRGYHLYYYSVTYSDGSTGIQFIPLRIGRD